MHQKHFNNIISKLGKDICSGCSHYNKEHNVCTLFKKTNKVNDFISHNPYYSKLNINYANEKPFYCKEYVAGYTVPTPEDNKFLPLDKPGC